MDIHLDALNRFLLLCVRAERTEADRQDMQALAEASVDWTELMAEAQRHRVLPMVYKVLRNLDEGLMPEDVALAWGHRVKHLAVRNLTRTSILFQVLDQFDKAGIEVIPYKGPVLAAMAYDQPGLRPFRDLDLMVRPQDARHALALLTRAEYETDRPLTAAQENALFRFGYDAEMNHVSGKHVLELHWGLTQPYFSFPFDIERACDHLKPVQVRGRPIRTFTPEDTLLLLCVHGVKHMWKRLQWVVDIAGLLRCQPGMNWPYVYAEAKQMGSLRMLHLGLALASDLIGATLPDEVQMAIRQDGVLPLLMDRTCHRLFNEPYDDPPLFDQIRYHLRARERRVDRLKYVIRFALVPTPEDCMAVSLPVSVLYYAARPMRLIWAVGGRR